MRNFKEIDSIVLANGLCVCVCVCEREREREREQREMETSK